MPKRVRNERRSSSFSLLLLVRDVLAFARFAEAVALDRAREDDGRLALVLGRRLVGVVDLHRIVAAEPQPLQLIVGEVLDHLEQPRVGAEEVLAQVGAASTAYFWYWPSTTSPIRLREQAVVVLRRAADPSRCPRSP